MAIEDLAGVPEDAFTLTPLGVVTFAMQDGGGPVSVMDALAEVATDMAPPDSVAAIALMNGKWVFTEIL